MNTPSRNPFRCALGLAWFASSLALAAGGESRPVTRPNILMAIADDWGWPHAGAYGDPVVKTPTFDRLAREGVLFHHAYVSSPSCTPCRGALLTGQWHWRLEGAGNLWSVFPDKFATYPERLVKAGYEVGVTGKGWGPGRAETPGRRLEGNRYRSFQEFLAIVELCHVRWFLGRAEKRRADRECEDRYAQEASHASCFHVHAFHGWVPRYLV